MKDAQIKENIKILELENLKKEENELDNYIFQVQEKLDQMSKDPSYAYAYLSFKDIVRALKKQQPEN